VKNHRWNEHRWNEPAVYYIMRGGRIIRRPHEDFKPIDPNSLLAKFNFDTIERTLLEHYTSERTLLEHSKEKP
jgi:hypothetical protein